MKVYARLEGDLGEMTPEDFLKKVKELKHSDDKLKKGNGVIVRISSDAEYFEVISGVNDSIQRSMNGSAIVNAPVVVWRLDGTPMPDGDGWRMIIVPQAMQAQQQPSRLARG